jgi:hypothetical protein
VVALAVPGFFVGVVGAAVLDLIAGGFVAGPGVGVVVGVAVVVGVVVAVVVVVVVAVAVVVAVVVVVVVVVVFGVAGSGSVKLGGNNFFLIIAS